MKRLNLDETWTLCLKMWRWIAGRIRKNPKLDVDGLKAEWLTKHHKGMWPHGWCYFCEYDNQHPGRIVTWYDSCRGCPLRVADDFARCYCQRKEWNYEDSPIAFYAKLRELHKKYKAKRKKK